VDAGSCLPGRKRRADESQQTAGNMVAMMPAMAEETVPPGKEPPFEAGEK
jgi:hypothetical protein